MSYALCPSNESILNQILFSKRISAVLYKNYSYIFEIAILKWIKTSNQFAASNCDNLQEIQACRPNVSQPWSEFTFCLNKTHAALRTFSFQSLPALRDLFRNIIEACLRLCCFGIFSQDKIKRAFFSVCQLALCV